MMRVVHAAMVVPTFSILALCLGAVAGQDFDFGGGGFGGGGSCPSFKCSDGYEAVPKRPLKLHSPGCSAMGGGMLSVTGKMDSDDEIGPCCDQRHACFSTCGASRTTCDRDFDACVEATCAASRDSEECESSAKLTSMMARMADCRQFSEAQSAACKCVAPEKAPAAREKVVADIYKKAAPEKLKQAGKVAQKGDSMKKFAALLTKLIAKYPILIKKVKDPQQEYMEKMMKEAREAEDESGGDGGGSRTHEEEVAGEVEGDHEEL